MLFRSFQSNSPVWPDDAYPHRIEFVVADELSGDIRAPSPSVAEALRLSANKQGALVFADTERFIIASDDAESALEDDVRQVLLDGPTDLLSLVAQRREQAQLRRLLLPGTSSSCALCGRTFPVAYLRVAHIKRRAECSDVERMDLANVMPVCVIGCDELFERGHVVVGRDGRITLVGSLTGTDLDSVAAPLVGRLCTHHQIGRAHV